jgi:hypothetical protein
VTKSVRRSRSRLLSWLRSNLADLIRKYCKKKTGELSESPGFPYRRLIFSLGILLSAEMSLEQIRDGVGMLVELHRHGCCSKACSRVQDIVRMLRNDSPDDKPDI